MKKFAFALDKVLDYKEQVENNLKNEYSQIAKRVKDQEQKLERLNMEFAGCRNEFEARKKQGCPVNVMITYDGYLNSIRMRIEEEKKVLEKLKIEEERKRQEMVRAKVETSSFERLKEKKKAEYDKDTQKQEEKFIEEFVSNLTSTRNAVEQASAV